MARPRLGDEDRRGRTVGVRVTEAEAEELQERAQGARLSVGAYLRRCAGWPSPTYKLSTRFRAVSCLSAPGWSLGMP